MNLYNQHNQPETLHNYEEAHEKMPFFILQRYTSRDEYRKREQAFTHEAEYAYKYAKAVKRGKFPEGEEAIASSIRYSKLYAKHVLKDSFPEGDQNMIDNMTSNDVNDVLLHLMFLDSIGKPNRELRKKFNKINYGR